MNNLDTVTKLLQQGEIQLLPLDNARFDAEILLCNVMHIDRSKLYAFPDMPVPAEKAKEYKNLLDVRSTGKPVAYLTGKKEFWSLEFTVNEYTLIPRPETECLVERALAYIPFDVDMEIADLGTGSGAIAIAIATERPRCKITATDICNNAIDIARFNADCHGVNNINFLISDWFEKLQGKFDLIVSNPPYVRNSDKHLAGDGIKHEPELALCAGEDGMDAIRTIVKNSVNYLNRNGKLIIEHGYQQAENTRSVFMESGLIEIQTTCDYAGVERVTSGIYRYE